MKNSISLEQDQEVKANDNIKSDLIEKLANKFLNINESTFVKLETLKSEEVNYYIPEKWDYFN